MNKCTDSDIQEMLPDLLHGALPADARGRVQAHLATCEECREDLEVLQTVNSAAVFAPKIDADRVVGQIPPYRMIVPGVEHPARTRVVSWLVAACFETSDWSLASRSGWRSVRSKVAAGPPCLD